MINYQRVKTFSLDPKKKKLLRFVFIRFYIDFACFSLPMYINTGFLAKTLYVRSFSSKDVCLCE